MNIRRLLKQHAVYWAPKPAGETGQLDYETPVEIRCRWEDKQEVQLEANSDNNWMSLAVVYLDRPVELQGVLWKGRYNQLVSTTDPFKNPGAAEVRRYSETPDKNATDKGTLRLAVL